MAERLTPEDREAYRSGEWAGGGVGSPPSRPCRVCKTPIECTKHYHRLCPDCSAAEEELWERHG